MHTDRVEFLNVGFDCLSADQLLETIRAMTPDCDYSYLVTPNVDHVVRLNRNAFPSLNLETVYRQASFCICDSRVLATLARWKGIRLPVTPGSDLAARLFREVFAPGDSVLVVGGNAATMDMLQKLYPKLNLIHHEPPMGLMSDPRARTETARFIAAHRARLSFICVGSPQAELIAAEVATYPEARGLALCVGAALEFIAGTQKRAPLLMRRAGMEWLHRLVSNPRRLWRRYLLEGPRVFLLAARWKKCSPRTLSQWNRGR